MPAAVVDLSETATFNGRLDANQRVAVVPQVSGIVRAIGFEAGALVEEGHVLFSIDQRIYAAAEQEAEGALRAAQAQRDLAQLERDRQAELVSRDAAAQATLDTAEATLASREADVLRLGAALDRARTNLSYTEITAPFAGIVSTASVDLGALVGPQTGPLATLVQLNPIHAEFQVPTATMRTYLERVERGEATRDAAVSIQLANGTIYDRMGDLDFVDSSVNAGTDSVMVRARFENPEKLLLDGELVRVTLTYDKPEGELAVPQQAVQRDVQGAFVLVVGDEDVAEMRRIDVSRSTQGYAVIGSGLEPGERVITEGVNKVRPGTKVDAAPAADG
jgi:membrane fusion protein (multidrug efflux system)